MLHGTACASRRPRCLIWLPHLSCAVKPLSPTMCAVPTGRCGVGSGRRAQPSPARECSPVPRLTCLSGGRLPSRGLSFRRQWPRTNTLFMSLPPTAPFACSSAKLRSSSLVDKREPRALLTHGLSARITPASATSLRPRDGSKERYGL